MNEKLEKIISTYTNIAPPYHRETRLQNDLGISSLAMVELIIALEEAFEMEFDLSAISRTKLTTVGYLSDMVENYEN